jgi:hypothetical protein
MARGPGNGYPQGKGKEKAVTRKTAQSLPANWSAQITRESNALDLEEGVFTWKDPASIARSLKKSADSSARRKSPPFRSAMSMLVFYINRAGSTLDLDRRRILEQAKVELRKLYGRRG